MRMIGRRRRWVGGILAVVAAFFLGFVCGGFGGPSGAAAIRVPAEAGMQQDPPPASQAPEASSPAAEESSALGADPPADPSLGPDVDQAADAPEPETPLVQDRPREFTADTGILLYFVSPEGESAFEETMARAAEALAASDSEERLRQAEGWRTYRAEEPLADGVLLYVSWLDPAVPEADYWIPDILNEAFPTEAQALYETYAGAFADGQILLNLRPVAGP